MDWAYKAMLTATTVALLLTVARLLGARIAGLLAGLPTITGPALVWLALDHGADYAKLAAIGSVAACVPCAAFALAYQRSAARVGALASLLLATATSAAVLPAISGLEGSLPGALSAGVFVVLLALAAMPVQRDGVPCVRVRGEPWLTAGVAGLVSAVVALTAPQSGPFWAGVLASPPLVVAAVAMTQHLGGGAAAATPFLRGYVGGLLGRVAFCVLLALLIDRLPLPLAAGLAIAGGCAFPFVVSALRGLLRRLFILPSSRRST
jgi:hypothetical protein